MHRRSRAVLSDDERRTVTEPGPLPRRLPAGVVPRLLLMLMVYQVGTGILAALVPVRLAQEGYAASVVGAVSAGFSLGFLAGCLGAPAAIAAVGSRYCIAVFAGVNAAAALLLWLAAGYPAVWGLSRATAGFATAAMFVLVEAWLAAESSPASRGAVFGLYMVINRLMFTAGQVLLAVVDPRHGGLFLLAALVYLLGALPSLWLKGQPPRIDASQRPALMELPRVAPAAAAACLFHGLVTTSGPALFPVYGLAQGLGVGQVALALAAIQFGGLVLQLPLALLSDRIERRTVLAGLTLATALLSLPLLSSGPLPLPVLLLLVALWGGVPAVAYSIAAAHANDLAREGRRIAWTSSLLLIWGIGAAGGPLAAALVMDRFGPRALFAFSAGLGAATTLFLVWRKLTRRAAGDEGAGPGRVPPAGAARKGQPR
jgi:MFS family permease